MVLYTFGKKKMCVFTCIFLCLYTVFYKMCFHKVDHLLKNELKDDEIKRLQNSLIQDDGQELLLVREGAKRSSNENANKDTSWTYFDILKTNNSRSKEMEIPMKETYVSKDLIRSQLIKEHLKAAQTTKMKLKFRNQWILWNEDSSSSNLNYNLKAIKNNYVAMNKYGVHFTGTRRTRKLSSNELLCELKQRVEVNSIQFGDESFATSKWHEHLPNRNLSQVLGPFRTCAVVASAGSILQSKLGNEIDAHDAVLRFNGAPTTGYESDVGSRTTIRVVNSQIISTQKDKFHGDNLFKAGVLIVWDPSPYSANLTEWYNHPDYNFFEDFIKYREENPVQPFYIINPKMQWQLWNILQENTPEDIQRCPPSSGLMGILIMMTICDQIDVYEFLPSLRQTDLCHYYEKYHDQACTVGAYHPLMFEKNLVKRINRSSNTEILNQGKATVPGFRTFQCPNPE
ncbi:beta-galactoside alpha-2,6-sialyltransferase 1-like [Narcine bancroftii]|uniref:beta-galactoside alpha-2,6-sialyltransferase 1-like n=1 Tax=Narcine bancroftii TaxID=1343680 RepID=UPI003831C591